MNKLELVPESDGYGADDGTEVIAIQLEGGSSFYRRDKIGVNRTISVKWILDAKQYQYWRAFFNTGTKKGSLPFLCPLVNDDGGVVDHICSFIPGSVRLAEQRGLAYIQTASLEVKPIMQDESIESVLVSLYGPSNGDPSSMLNLLATLVTVTMPAKIGG